MKNIYNQIVAELAHCVIVIYRRNQAPALAIQEF